MAQVQPYVLRSWEAEFPQLGRAPAGGGPRVYRRADVEMVLRIKQLVFGEGLTLAGARRRLDETADATSRRRCGRGAVLGDDARSRAAGGPRRPARPACSCLSADARHGELGARRRHPTSVRLASEAGGRVERGGERRRAAAVGSIGM